MLMYQLTVSIAYTTSPPMRFPLLQGTCEMTRRGHYLLITPIGCG